MTKAAFDARLYAIEWHVELWRRNGTPIDQCKATLDHLEDCLWADHLGEPRAEAPDRWSTALERYLDGVFAARDNVVSFSGGSA